MRTLRKLPCLLSALLVLTGCGDRPLSAEQQSSAAESSAAETTEAPAEMTAAAETAAVTAETDAAASETAETAAAETKAPETAAQEPQNPDEEPAQEKPELKALFFRQSYLTGPDGEGMGEIGDECSVVSLFDEWEYAPTAGAPLCDMRYQGKRWTPMRCDEIMLRPDTAYLESISDGELKYLLATMNLEANLVYLDFVQTGGTLGLSGTGDYADQYERLSPAKTMADYEAEFGKYFAADFRTAEESPMPYIIERDGALCRLFGYGGPGCSPRYTVDRIASRTADEIVCDMRVKIIQDYDRNVIEMKETKFGIRNEDGIWKCSLLDPIWCTYY